MSSKEQVYCIQVAPLNLPTGVDGDGGSIYSTVMEAKQLFVRAATIEYQKNGATETIMMRDANGYAVYSGPLHMVVYIIAVASEKVCDVIPIRLQLAADKAETGTDITH